MDEIHGAAGATDVPPPVTWTDIEPVLAQRRLALFLDYDGTLTPIAPRPDLANLSDETRRLLVRLARHMPVTVITGRDLGDVKERVGLDQLIYVGSHGFDVEGPGIVGRPDAASDERRDVVARIGRELDEKIADVPGVILEPKRFSAAVHYRLVPDQHIAPMLAVVDQIADREAGLRVSKGKKLVELRPDVDWDKGTALLWVVRALGLETGHVLPLFVGDDVTDEDGFMALRNAGAGYGVVVCDPPRASYAHGRVPDTDAVQSLLVQIAAWAEAGT